MSVYRRRRGDLFSADFVSGALFLAIGLFFSVYAYSMSLGSFARLGPGAFPFGVGVLLSLIGAAIALKALAGSSEAMLRFDAKSLVLIALALLVGGATLTSLGVIVAVPATVLLASLASASFRLRTAVAMALLLTLFTYLVFILGLGLQLPLYPGAF